MLSFKQFLTEAIQYTYKIPAHMKFKIADFYIWTALSGFTGTVTPRQNLFGQNTAADIQSIVIDATDKIVDEMYESVKAAGFASILSELSHLGQFSLDEFPETFTGKKNDKANDVKEMFKAIQWVDWQEVKIVGKHLGLTLPNKIKFTPSAVEKNIDSLQEIYNVLFWLNKLQSNYSEGRAGKLPDPIITKKAQFHMKKYFGSERSLVEFASKMFIEGLIWPPDYAGTPWKMIADGWIELNAATGQNRRIAAIDHMFDLQHNNGFALNKVKDFQGTWVKPVLDAKRRLSLERLQEMSSIPSRPFYIIANYYSVPVKKGDSKFFKEVFEEYLNSTALDEDLWEFLAPIISKALKPKKKNNNILFSIYDIAIRSPGFRKELFNAAFADGQFMTNRRNLRWPVSSKSFNKAVANITLFAFQRTIEKESKANQKLKLAAFKSRTTDKIMKGVFEVNFIAVSDLMDDMDLT